MQSFVALVTVLGDAPPGLGHPDQGLPGGGAYPDQGLPGGGAHPGNRPPGSGAHPGNRPPGSGAHPGNRPPGSGSGGQIDNSLPEGEPIEINPPLPDPPPQYADKVVVAVKKPDEPWKATAFEVDDFPDNELPPAPQPKR